MRPRPIVDWIAFNFLPGLGSILQHRALERFGDPAEIAYRVSGHELRSLKGARFKIDELERSRDGLARRAERERRRCEKLGIRLLPLDDPDYPASLAALADPPVLLYLRGELPHGVTRIAVVGSRAATAYGRKVATGLAAGLAARGVEIVSGGARGIDSAAHRGALAEEGRTTVVMGSGLLCPYPPENKDLFDRILAAGGALVSEFPLEHPPYGGQFPRRNRLISGLCAAVVVVEAARRSGSLNTAAHALEQGREVLAVPGPVSSLRSVGANRLIQQGAKLVQNIEDILEELSPLYRGALPSGGADPTIEAAPNLEDLLPDERAVLGILDEIEPVHLDDLVDRAPFGIGRLQAALFGLLVRGAVDERPGRYYLLRPQREI
jgi:DNA processing protein